MLDHTSDPNTPEAVPLENDSLYFLFYSPDTTIHFDPFNFDGNIASSRGNDALVVARKAGPQLSNQIVNITSDWEGNAISSDGYFYSLVFDYQDSSLDVNTQSTWDISIPVGTFSFVSDISPLVSFDDITVPTVVPANSGGTWPGGGGAGAGSAVVSTEIIPEPTTMGLLLMALMGGVSVYRRRKQRA